MINLEKKLLALKEKIKSLGEIDPANITKKDKIRLREYKKFNFLAEKIEKILVLEEEIEILHELLENPETKEIAEEEIDEKKSLKEKEQNELEDALSMDDEEIYGNIVMEIRAGTGGDEAAIFASDLLRMYTRYIERQPGWKMEILDISAGDFKGIKSCSILIKGEAVHRRLFFESGVHRVQRVPATEANGRLHTSTASVVILPEPEEIDVEIRDEDLRIDLYRASGAGGQHVNTTDSAVRLTHLPTGIVVQCQDQRSQHENKRKAIMVLKMRIFEEMERKRDSELDNKRQNTIKTGDRSDKSRTYNFPQNRITDHRFGVTLYRLNYIMEGDLEEFFDKIFLAHKINKLGQ